MADDSATQLQLAAERIAVFAENAGAGKQVNRAELDDAIGALRAAAVRHFGPRPAATKGNGGKAKILAYLRADVGDWWPGPHRRVDTHLS